MRHLAERTTTQSKLNELFITAVLAGLLLLATFAGASAAHGQPQLEGSTLTLPRVQVGDQILSLSMELTVPETLTFELDFLDIGLVAEQAQAACIDPYFSIASNQLVIPVLELGSDRYFVLLDLVDAQLGLFQVNPGSLLLTTVTNPGSPAFTVWQTGNSIAAEWGSPSVDADDYQLWYSSYQGGDSMLMENVGGLTSVTAELPPGVDFCLTVTSSGPNGDSDFSTFERFTNLETPFTAYNTDDPALPTLFFPAQDDQQSMALMHDAGDDNEPYGAVFQHADEEQNLILAYNPQHGLLSRITLGDVAFHFVNYTATTVDLVQTELEGETAVYPDLPLTNHAVSVIESLADAFDSAQQPLVLPTAIDPDSLQQADWAKKGLELGRDILQSAGFDAESSGAAALEEVADFLSGFHGDIFKTELGDTSTQALEEAQQALDSMISNFDCDGDPGYSCAAYGVNQAQISAFLDSFPDTADQFQNLAEAAAEAEQQRQALNQDCSLIENPQERQACLDLQGNPEPGEQEDPLPINDSLNDGVAAEIEALQQAQSQAENSLIGVALDDSQRVLTLNQLYFEYETLIGQSVWVLGYFGNLEHNSDGYAFLVDDYAELLDSDVLPAESFARLDGGLPPSDWDSAEILVYGEVKDFATESGLSAELPTPLITVSDFVQITPPEPEGQGASPLAFRDLAQAMTMPGTQASACDRVVIISGGVDDNNNHDRYPASVKKMHERMIALGFGKDQIDVFYYDGTAIDSGGENIVDSAANKAAILAKLAALKQQMQGSCTLMVLVSDHGTGYSEAKGYRGARAVFTGHDASESGMLYDESSFKVDARKKTWLVGNQWVVNGKTLAVDKLADGTYEVFVREGGEWKLKASGKPEDPDNPGNSGISEVELDTDLDGDNNKENNYGLRYTTLESKLTNERKYRDNQWDTDGDGTIDTRMRWDGTRYVFERLVGEEWREMGRDTNGDFMIDGEDGGVDWNLDGDKGDKVGFSEGINLLEHEVLWDDELVDALKMLDDMNVHIAVQMSSCYSGGFRAELEGIVEYLFVGSKEDMTHLSRGIGGGRSRMVDQEGFFDNLHGIDLDSLMHAGTKAQELDDAARGRFRKNDFFVWKTPKYESESLFEEGPDGEYKIDLDIPEELASLGLVYDFEIFFGLQKPRWDAEDFELLGDLPDGLEVLGIDGGFKVVTNPPLPLFDNVKFRIRGPAGVETMRFELTDINHTVIGQVMAMPGEVDLLTKFESQSVFESPGANVLNIELDLPEELQFEVFDFEIYTNQQQPAWSGEIFPVSSMLAPGLQAIPIPVEEGGPGLRFESLEGNQIKDLLQFAIEGNGIENTSMMRIELTDAEHEVLGYVMATPGEVTLVPKLEDSSSAFEQYPDAGILRLNLDIPPGLENSVYDFEIYYDQQEIPLIGPVVPDLATLPAGLSFSFVDGGIRLESSIPGLPIPDNLEIELLAVPTIPLSMLRIELTDQQHEPLGWVMAMPGVAPPPVVDLFDPGFHQQFEVHWTGTMLPPDPLVLNPGGSALLGPPPPFPGSWQVNDNLYFQFGGGLTFMDLPQPPIPPGLCFTHGQGIHFSQETTEGIVCPVDPLQQLFLNGGRHRVEGSWQQGMTAGPGFGYAMRRDSAGMTFSGQNNQWDAYARVIDGCAVNGYYWAYFAATTDSHFMLTVTDEDTGEVRAFSNSLGGVPQPELDLWAFDCQAAAD